MNHSSETKKKERKKGGVWGHWLSGGSAAVKIGAPRVGGAAGLLATKAGLVALIVIGTTVAGGLSVVGYRFLGGEGAPAPERFNSIFQPRPKVDQAAAAGAYPAPSEAQGASSSLQFLSDANRGSAAWDGSSAEPQFSSKEAQDAHAAGMPGVSGAAAGGSVSAPAAQQPGKPFAPPKKIGELSKNFGGGSPGAMGAVKPGAASGDVSLAASGRGASSGMKNAAARPGFGAQRSLAYNRASGAGRQLMSVRRDNVNPASSAQGGRTYDGGANRVGTTDGEDAASEGGINSGKDGAGDKAPAANAKGSTPDALEKVLPVQGAPMTPWQKGIETARYLIMGALALMYLATKAIDAAAAASVAQPYSQAVVRGWLVVGGVLLALATAAGLAAMAIGINIMTGEYKQTSAGLPLALAGAAAAAAAGFALQSVMSDQATGTAWNSQSAAQTKIQPISGGAEVLMYVCGGAAAVGLAVSMLMKPDKINPGEKGYDPNDDHGWGIIVPAGGSPSDQLLERYLA